MPRCARLVWLLLFGFATCCSISAVAAESTRPRNVLLIVSDDLNNLLGCYGDPLVKTPHLDRLASRGARFQHAYCMFPLCGPSRNAMLTGLYPNSTGVLKNGEVFRQTIPDQISLPQAFRQQGYLAARIGKLFHYSVPNSIGTNGHDDPASWELELNPAGVDRLEEHPKIFSLTPNQFGGTLSWYASPHHAARHTDGLNAADAAWVLERCARQRERPFFLAVGFFRPHTPYVAPREYFEMYPASQMPVVTDIEADQRDIPPAGLASRKADQDAMTDDLRRECRQAYYASISMMDAQVGQVIDALDRLQLADDTVIVFTSDHGYHMGEHGLWQKMSLFEESARVPLLIVAPGISKPGTVVDTPVAHIDLFPTLGELCGVTTPVGLPGQSLVPMLQDSNASGRGWALSQVSRSVTGSGRRTSAVTSPERRTYFGYSLRTPRWRYTEWDGGDQGRELYDHSADARELTNLAALPEHVNVVADLSAQLAQIVPTTFPVNGKTPAVAPGLWTPLLTQP